MWANDILVGGGGDDHLFAGAGDDILWGGARDSEGGRSDGIDTAHYFPATAAIEITIGAASVEVADGQGDTDTLHSIEIIGGTSHDDKLIIEALTAGTAAAFDYIDLQSGKDSIDLSAVAGKVTADLSNPSDQTITLHSGGVLHLKNVEVHNLGSSGTNVAKVGAGVEAIDGGSGDKDELELVWAGGTRVDGESGAVLMRAGLTFGFTGFEKVTGSEGGNMVYGGDRQIHYVGGGGLNYLEGAGEETKLESGAGDSYILASNGARVISGGGNDLIEVEGEAPVTIVFTRGSGHDVLGSHFAARLTTANDDQAVTWGSLSSTHDTEGGTNFLRVLHDWVGNRGQDTILFEGLGPGDLELVWDWETTYIHGDWQDNPEARIGPAAIRITETGDTLYLGILMGWSGSGAAVFGPEEMLPFSLYIVSPGSFDGYDGGWDTPLDDEAVSIPGVLTLEVDLFEFGDGQRYSLMDIFLPGSVASTPLPAEWSEAKDLLSRLGNETGVVAGTEGDDSLSGTEGDDDMIGGDGGDDIDPGAGDDFVRGGRGDDYVMGGAGDDNYHGGDGRDSVDYYASAAPVTVDLAAGTAAGADIGADRLTAIESVYGGLGDDSLAGNAGSNSLYGDDGADLLDARDGGDWLNGGGGADLLTGGTGADLFFFQPGGTGLGSAADLIADFAPGEDRIDLSWIDADVATEGNQLFTYIGGAAFTRVAGELRYAADGGDGRLQADLDGDGIADFEILLAGALAPLATDFI